MSTVKQRMIDIVNSVPDNYFYGLELTEMVYKLIVEYVNKYGEDKEIINSNANKYFNDRILEEKHEEQNQIKEEEKMDFIKQTLNQIDVQDDELYNIIYDLFFFAELRESEEDIKNGRVCTLEELNSEMEARYENYNHPKS